MSYAALDATISSWADKHSLRLYTKWPGGDIRCVYLWSTIGECFQIWIAEPQEGCVAVHAADIETRDDEELSAEVTVQEAMLGNALEDMLTNVYGWMKRHDASATFDVEALKP
jgi:hypothetical protein